MRLLLLFSLLSSSLLAACAAPRASGFAFEPDPVDSGHASASSSHPGDDDADTIATSDDDDAPVDVPIGDDDADVPDPDDAGVDEDASAGDALPPAACDAPPGPGDLVFDELMIASLAGSGDHGEWVEIVSTRDCALNLDGLHGDVPVGSKVVSFEIDGARWLPARGRILVADSDDAAIDHDLPLPVFTWTGQPGDVLRNQGSTLTLRLGAQLVDALTYPATKIAPGTSFAFPDDCDPAKRAAWDAWQPSTRAWFPGFFGTPNAPNDDVHCRSP